MGAEPTLKSLEEKLQLNAKELKKVVLRAPAMLSLKPDNVEKHVNMMENMISDSLGLPEVKKLVVSHPRVLYTYCTSTVRVPPRVEQLKKTSANIDRTQLKAVVEDNKKQWEVRMAYVGLEKAFPDSHPKAEKLQVGIAPPKPKFNPETFDWSGYE